MSTWYPKYCCDKPWQDCPSKTKCNACQGQCDHYVVIDCNHCEVANTNVEPYYCDYNACINASQRLCDPDPCTQDPSLPECDPKCIGGCSYFEDSYQPTNLNCEMRSMYQEGITNAQLGKVWWDASTYHDKGYFPNGSINMVTEETNFRDYYPNNLPNWNGVPRIGRGQSYCSYDGLPCRDNDAGLWSEYYFGQDVIAPNNWYPTSWDANAVGDFINNPTPFSRLDMNRRWHIYANLEALSDRNKVGLTIRVAHNGMAWRAYYDRNGNLENDGSRTGSMRITKIIYLESMDGGMRDTSGYLPEYNYVEFNGQSVDFKFQLYDYANNQYAEDDHYFQGTIT